MEVRNRGVFTHLSSALWGETTLRSILLASVLPGLLVAAVFVAPTKAVTIGPDSFGYTASNTAVPYNFEEVSITGTNLLLGIGTSSSVNFGFTFNFYGTPYTSAFINSNGYFHFASASNDLSNKDLTLDPAPISGQNIPGIFPYWDDWDPTGADNVYTQTLGSPGSRRFVAQWQNVYNFNTGQRGTFEAILFEGSNNILYQYKAVSAVGNGGGGTIGIRDTGAPANGKVLQWSHNTTSIGDSTTVLFSLIPEPTSLMLIFLAAPILAHYVRSPRRRQT